MILPIKQNCNHLATVGDGHEYYARGRDNLQNNANTQTKVFLKNKPTITGIKLYNNQPQEIKNKGRAYHNFRLLKTVYTL